MMRDMSLQENLSAFVKEVTQWCESLNSPRENNDYERTNEKIMYMDSLRLSLPQPISQSSFSSLTAATKSVFI
jgi:hypothetical protein